MNPQQQDLNVNTQMIKVPIFCQWETCKIKVFRTFINYNVFEKTIEISPCDKRSAILISILTSCSKGKNRLIYFFFLIHQKIIHMKSRWILYSFQKVDQLKITLYSDFPQWMRVIVCDSLCNLSLYIKCKLYGRS